MLPIILVLLGVVVIAAIVLVVVGLRSSQEGDALQARLGEFLQRGESATLEEIELSQPFTERIVYPLARKFGELALKVTPQNAIQNIDKKLEQAGNPRGLEATVFFTMRLIASAGFGILLIIVFALAPTYNPLETRSILITGAFTALGFYLPDLWLTSQINRRQKEIRRAMPDALDLLTICVEAGLGFDAAMKKVNEKWDDELALAFGRVIQEIQLGKLRRDALRAMAERVGVAEMTSFVASIIQSEQLGVSMAKVLRIQSDNMRVKRRQLAEEEAQKAPIKMLFPLAFLVMPSLFIVLLGPAVLLLMKSSLGGIF